MANKICRITIFAYMFPEWEGSRSGYDNSDLENGIMYCQEYLDSGLTHEAMDGFSLQGYIDWAKKEIAEERDLPKESKLPTGKELAALIEKESPEKVENKIKKA